MTDTRTERMSYVGRCKECEGLIAIIVDDGKPDVAKFCSDIVMRGDALERHPTSVWNNAVQRGHFDTCPKRSPND